MNKKNLLTIEDLVKFCEENKFSSFSSKESGYKIVVQSPATFEIDEDNNRAGLLRLKLKVSHIGKNRNGSFISEENMKKAMPSIKNRPILAHIHQLDNGEWDFEAHNMEIVQNEDGEEEINYIERQVGSFTEDEPFLEYDEKNDKTYVIAYAVIPEEYTKAAEIIRRKKGTKNSCELHIDSFSYNAKEHYIELEDFRYRASTLLGSRENGTEIIEGMQGSRADIADFSEENNSLFSEINKEDLIEMQEKLNSILSRFNINNTEETPVINDQKKGGNQVFEELLAKYNKTKEDIDFEYENLSAEELESKFVEIFGKVNIEVNENKDENNESTEGVTETSEENRENFSTKERNVTFELSFDEIYAGINALCSIYRNDDEWCYVQTVYEKYFIMHDWDNDKFYKQSYEKDGDNLSLSGERIELFSMFLTESEKIALDEMRSNYSIIESELKAYKKEELDAKKDKIFEDESYKAYLESKEFKELIDNKDNYSLEELQDKAEIAFAKCVRKNGLYSIQNEIESKISKHKLTSTKVREKKPYGSIFNKRD